MIPVVGVDLVGLEALILLSLEDSFPGQYCVFFLAWVIIKFSYFLFLIFSLQLIVSVCLSVCLCICFLPGSSLNNYPPPGLMNRESYAGICEEQIAVLNLGFGLNTKLCELLLGSRPACE